MTNLNDNDGMFIERFLNAFKTIGGNEQGFVDYEDFKSLLLKKSSIEGKGILNLINEEQHVHDGKLDFISLCFSILTVKSVFNSFSAENGKIVLSSPRFNSRTFTRSKGSENALKNQQKESNAPPQKKSVFTKSLKGLLFQINKDLLGHRYQLNLLESTVVEIIVKGITAEADDCKIPIEILVFQDNKKKIFITSSSISYNDGYVSTKFSLQKGKYILIPVLLKWNESTYLLKEQHLKSLIHIDEESNVSLTPSCESALKTVYNAIDLDGNGLLNQLEFDLFIRHTSGETAIEEWAAIEDNFKMKDGELTFEGFLEIYKLVLQTDFPDMVNMFQRMGMSDTFELKNSQQFILTVKLENYECSLHPLPVSSYSEVSEKIFKKLAVEQGSSSKIKNMNDLFLFKHQLPYRCTFVVQNQSHSKITVQLDCSKSVNCQSHRQSLDCSLEISPRTSMIVHHLFPVDITKEWNVECKESFK